MSTFADGLPKAELHLHLEGTLEPQLAVELAARNKVPAPYEAGVKHDFRDLAGFLAKYYQGMSVLLTEQDFYDLAMAYFRRAAADNIVYAEVFFDPQAHTSRGVGFDAIIGGFHRARLDAAQACGVRAQLIMCFLRDMTAESAMDALEQSLPYRDKIVGVGLDSDERGNPPVKFAEVFARARDAGYRLTMHCDADQEGTIEHLWQCVDVIGVERIDHGVNCLEDSALVDRLRRDGLGLTVCPVSARWTAGGLKERELKTMLDVGLQATVNSDDPAYFGAYLNENFRAVGVSDEQALTLVRNSFQIAWLPAADKAGYLARLDDYASRARSRQ